MVNKTKMEMLKMILRGINRIISYGKFPKECKEDWEQQVDKFLELKTTDKKK